MLDTSVLIFLPPWPLSRPLEIDGRRPSKFVGTVHCVCLGGGGGEGRIVVVHVDIKKCYNTIETC